MKHCATPRFWRCYQGVPEDVRDLADRNYELLKSDPTHRSLHLEKIGQYWSVRIGRSHRALAVEAGSDLVWFWLGSHAEYDRLVGRQAAQKARRKTRH